MKEQNQGEAGGRRGGVYSRAADLLTGYVAGMGITMADLAAWDLARTPGCAANTDRTGATDPASTSAGLFATPDYKLKADLDCHLEGSLPDAPESQPQTDCDDAAKNAQRASVLQEMRRRGYPISCDPDCVVSPFPMPPKHATCPGVPTGECPRLLGLGAVLKLM